VILMDKVKEIEERLDRLENRLKATFLEIEKRFEQLQSSQPVQMAPEDRLQELEDLILLMQLEITKLKKNIGEGLEFGPAPAMPDVEERLHKLEESTTMEVLKEGAKESPHTYAKLQQLEERISMLEKHGQPDFNKEIKTVMSKQLDEIEKRLDRLEQERSESILSSKSILEDVRKILSA